MAKVHGLFETINRLARLQSELSGAQTRALELAARCVKEGRDPDKREAALIKKVADIFPVDLENKLNEIVGQATDGGSK